MTCTVRPWFIAEDGSTAVAVVTARTVGNGCADVEVVEVVEDVPGGVARPDLEGEAWTRLNCGLWDETIWEALSER